MAVNFVPGFSLRILHMLLGVHLASNTSASAISIACTVNYMSADTHTPSLFHSRLTTFLCSKYLPP